MQAFHPTAVTLEHAFFVQRQQPTEEALWAVLLQLLAAVHAVHNAGMAVRALDASHVLITGKDSIKLSGAGLLDATRPDSRTLQQLQHEDLVMLGCLFVNLACASPTAPSVAHTGTMRCPRRAPITIVPPVAIASSSGWA